MRAEEEGNRTLHVLLGCPSCNDEAYQREPSFGHYYCPSCTSVYVTSDIETCNLRGCRGEPIWVGTYG